MLLLYHTPTCFWYLRNFIEADGQNDFDFMPIYG